MGLYFRKSVNLGGGVRLNFSKSGIGISAGVKGARISTGPRGTYANFSIPGTGVRYTKKISSTSSSSRTSPTSRYPYVRTITNAYTGRSRTVRAATQWELNSLVATEESRMKAEELRQRDLDRINNLRERATTMTKQVQEQRAELNNILNYTLDIDDRLDWDAQYNKNEYPEFNFSEEKPIAPNRTSGGFFSFFKKNINDDEYEEKIAKYEQRKTDALSQYLVKKEAFEKEKREHNIEIDYLRKNFESSEKSAVEKYTSIILSNSNYPSGLDMDFDVEYNRSVKTVIVSFLMPPQADLPLVDSYRFSPSNNEIVPKNMIKYEDKALYEHTLFAICIRTMHEIYEAIYTDAVHKIIFNAYLLKDDIIETDDFAEHVRCIFSISSEKDTFLKLNLKNANIEGIIMSLGVNRAKDFSIGEIEPTLI